MAESNQPMKTLLTAKELADMGGEWERSSARSSAMS
jgi:hypothetical protein